MAVEFVKNPKGDNQRKIDLKLQEKLINWRDDFMLLLLEYYQIYSKSGLIASRGVLNWTNMYKEETDSE